MSDSGDWYCKQCGYIDDSRVTFSETCDECHIPAEFHTVEDQKEITRLKEKLDDAQETMLDMEKESIRLKERVKDLEKLPEFIELNPPKSPSYMNDLEKEVLSDQVYSVAQKVRDHIKRLAQQ